MLALFEFIPTKEIIAWLQEKAGLKEAVVEMKSVDGGAETRSTILQNGGSMLIIGALTITLVLILVIASCCCKSLLLQNQRIYKIYNKVLQKIFYNSIIRYFYTSAIKL